eukprot:g82207.t1
MADPFTPGYSRQLGALLPTARDSVPFSATSAFLCVFLTFIPRKKLGNLRSLLSNNTSFKKKERIFRVSVYALSSYLIKYCK